MLFLPLHRIISGETQNQVILFIIRCDYTFLSRAEEPCSTYVTPERRTCVSYFYVSNVDEHSWGNSSHLYLHGIL